jgi:L-fucose isomerase-like protein
VDLSEILHAANGMKPGEPAVRAKLQAIRRYTQTGSVPADGLERMARLGVAIDRWIANTEVRATAVQCWTSLEACYGVVPCSLMSMLSERLLPSACETDIGGLLGMYVMQCASGRPSALLDWNNNYGTDPDKGVFFHCSNLPKAFFGEHHMDYQAIIAGSVGQPNSYGTMVGRIRPGPFTYCRLATDDAAGRIAGYVGEGEITDDPLETFGGYGVFAIPDLQGLLSFICERGFEHHVALNLSEVSDPVHEALVRYRGWDIHAHEA